MRIERLEVRVYRIPTDGSEEDGTFHWESTTVVLVKAVAEDEQRGLGYSYASVAAGTLIAERLGPSVIGCDVEDVGAAWGARKEYAFTFLVVNQAMPEHSIHTELVRLILNNTTKPSTVFVERIDADHANPKKVWQEMGEPEYPNAYEIDSLKASSELVKEPLVWTYDGQGTVHIQLSVPPQSVAAVTLELGVEGMRNVVSQRGAEKST